MTDSNLSQDMLQERIKQVLARLEALHEQIERLREENAELEKPLAIAEEEYQDAVAGLENRVKQLQTECRSVQLRAQAAQTREKDGTGQGDSTEEPDPDQKKTRKREDKPLQPIGAQSWLQTEALDKEDVLEFVTWALDPEDEKGGELLATLQDMCRNPAARLADMLQLVPMPLWHKDTPAERANLERRLKRLRTWERALVQLLGSLKREDERIKNDPRYRRMEARAKGPEHWQKYLDERKKVLQEKIDRLESDLERELQACARQQESPVPPP